jgi:hypothetical protein
MNIEQMISGIAYFERLFNLAGLGQNNVGASQRQRSEVIFCPISNRRFSNINSIRQLSVPFIVSVRNIILARPWDFVDQENFIEILRRYTALVMQSGIEETDFSLGNWLRGHQIIEALQQRNNNRFSDLNAPIVQEYRSGMTSQTISVTETPILLSQYTGWQISVLTGGYRNDFNIISTQAQSDFANINQRGLQGATFSELSRHLTIISGALRDINFGLQNSNNPQIPENTPEEVLLDFFPSPVAFQYETTSTNNANAARGWPDDDNEEKEEPAPEQENNDIVIAPIECREIVIPNANHFIYQGQQRLTNLSLVGSYLHTLALPSIPLIQPYDPNSNARPDVISGTNIPHGNIRVSVAIQIPQEHADLPVGVLERLAEQNIEREFLEIFISVQDNPWENNAKRLLRVHPYIHPFAEGNDGVEIENTVQISLAELGRRFTPFSEHSVQTHHGVFSPQNMQIIGDLNFERTHALYSLCTNSRTNRIGLTLHILLSDLNQRLILNILDDVNLDSIDEFIDHAAIINAVSEENDQFPIIELQYLTGRQARPQIALNSLMESQYQLAIEVRRTLSTAINLPSEESLSQQFSSQHSAGGENPVLEAAANRAGLNFVETVLGRGFRHVLDISAAQRLNMLIENFSKYLMERLSINLQENINFLGELDPENYNQIDNPHVYFHPYSITIRSILYNSRIRSEYHNGILLRVIAAIWDSVRNLPNEERQNCIDNISMQMHEIQRAYNIARFYQKFFYADERNPEDWVNEENHRVFKINNAKDEWNIVEENIDRVRSTFINKPIRNAPDELIPDDELSNEQRLLRYAHRTASQREEKFERVRDFILNTSATDSDGTISITHEMAGIEVVTRERSDGGSETVLIRTGRGVLEDFVRIIELTNRIYYPTSAILTDNFRVDVDSCGIGAETRLLDIANTLPEVSMVIVSPLQATQLFQEFISSQLPQWIDEVIIANYTNVVPIREMLQNNSLSVGDRVILSELFEPVRQRICSTLEQEAVNSPQVRVALTVRNNRSGELVLDEVTQILLEGFNIHKIECIAPEAVYCAEEEYAPIEEYTSLERYAAVEQHEAEEAEVVFSESEAESDVETSHTESSRHRRSRSVP